MAGFFAFFRAPRFAWLFFFMMASTRRPTVICPHRMIRPQKLEDHVRRVKVVERPLLSAHRSCRIVATAMTETAEVVIVGAGIMGVSTAYHLARLGAAATRALCPYLNTDDLLGATYTPRDGYADPYLCATAIAARARGLGVVIKQQHEVHGFLRDGDRVRGVTTAAGAFEAPAVVIATGAWSGVVGKLAGVDIPIRPHRRHKFMTAPFPVDRIPAATPFVIDPHRNFSLRRKEIGRAHV